MPISRELKAKINALPYEDLKVRIRNVLNMPGQQAGTDEEIFEHIVASYMRVMAQRAAREGRMYRWRDDEVVAFVEHFKKESPHAYSEFLRQEREYQEIDADLWFGDLPTLAKQWHPGLDDDDYRDLRSKVRDYVQAHLI